jgi:transposase
MGAFCQEQVLINKAELIELRWQAKYWEAQHGRSLQKIELLKETVRLLEARIKDMKHRLFGKKSEKATATSETSPTVNLNRKRGQQPSSRGHGRTFCPTLPVQEELIEVAPNLLVCTICGAPMVPRPALDAVVDIKEIIVQPYIRRIRRHAHVRTCSCSGTPKVVTAPPPARLIPRSPYGVSIWDEVLLSKYFYAQPTHRLLRDWKDQGLVISAGTVAGGLRAIAPLFVPIVDAFYARQMTETLFHGDETRWEVFEDVTDKVGSRWYLWLIRSASVIFYTLDPTRSAAVPGAHFAGLQSERAILVCDRYSAYKKLARLSGIILLAFCWAHVRRDFLEAGRSMKSELEQWALEWRERIGNLYHLNAQRLEVWQPNLSLTQQSAAFQDRHQALAEALESVHDEAKKLAAPISKSIVTATIKPVPKSANQLQRECANSLLDHWQGLKLFLDYPAVPMDNNAAENAIRGPVTGRKNYYGSGSLWSADLTATMFTIFQTFALWGIPVRDWLTGYLQACAENGGKPPIDVTPFLPWSLVDKPPKGLPPSPFSVQNTKIDTS